MTDKNLDWAKACAGFIQGSCTEEQSMGQRFPEGLYKRGFWDPGERIDWQNNPDRGQSQRASVKRQGSISVSRHQISTGVFRGKVGRREAAKRQVKIRRSKQGFLQHSTHTICFQESGSYPL